MEERVWTGSPEEAWKYFRDHAAALGPLIEGVPAHMWDEVTHNIVAAISDFPVGSAYNLRAQINLAVAAK